MPRMIDHDGKSQTASSVDRDHYPTQTHEKPPGHAAPTREQIADLAHELWVARGRPLGSAELDWHEAEERLMQRERDQAGIAEIHARGGSVQH